jgi:hypothetical protein
MKRLLVDESEAEKTEILVAYFERKLSKHKARLEELRGREQRNLVLANLFNCYQESWDRRQPMLMLKQSTEYEHLIKDREWHHDDIVSHRVCQLTYCAKAEGGHIQIKVVRVHQNGEDVGWPRVGASYLIEQLKLLVRVECGARGGQPPDETEERHTQVMLIQALSDAEAARYWTGPWDCVISTSVERVADKSGHLCGYWTRAGDIADGDDPAHRNDSEMQRDEWLAEYAHFSPRHGLWFCKRTWAEMGEKGEI